MSKESSKKLLGFSEVARILNRSTKWVKMNLALFPNTLKTPHAGRIGGFEYRIPESDVDEYLKGLKKVSKKASAVHA